MTVWPPARRFAWSASVLGVKTGSFIRVASCFSMSRILAVRDGGKESFLRSFFLAVRQGQERIEGATAERTSTGGRKEQR